MSATEVKKSGFKLAGDFNRTGLKVSVPGGTTNTPGKAILVSGVIPAGARAFLELWSAKVIDIANSNQVYFVITKNGQSVQAGSERIPGTMFDFMSQMSLNLQLTPGLIEIAAYNISGMSTTIEPDAIAAVPVNCQAWWAGSLLSERMG